MVAVWILNVTCMLVTFLGTALSVALLLSLTDQYTIITLPFTGGRISSKTAWGKCVLVIVTAASLYGADAFYSGLWYMPTVMITIAMGLTMTAHFLTKSDADAVDLYRLMDQRILPDNDSSELSDGLEKKVA